MRRRAAWQLRTALVLVALPALTGCEFDNAEFVMRDRPQMTEMRGDAPVTFYVVHVGDAPMLAFRSKLYFCDYAIMHDSTTDTYEDCGPDLGGAFEWPYEFDKVSPPGEFTTLEVKAYARKGKRDYMPYKGKVMELEVGTDPGDSFAAKAQILVRVYQSRLEIPVDLRGKEPLWHAARLEMAGRGVRKRRIHYSKSPHRGDFSVEGPDGSGRYMVVYEPTIRDIDPTGVTKAVLKVPDEDGRFHEFTAALRPPSEAVREGPAGEGTDAPAGGGESSDDRSMAPVSFGWQSRSSRISGGIAACRPWGSAWPPGFCARPYSLGVVAPCMLALEGKHGTRSGVREGNLAPATMGGRDG